MIEAATARELVERLRQVEERLGRMLASGWRQARAEAVELQRDADVLAEMGLAEVATRIGAVARANDAAEALPAVALAVSACRLLRARLLAGEPPEGWSPLTTPRAKTTPSPDTVVPIARLVLDGREVWACGRPTRGQWLLIEPPFPVQEPVAPAPAASEPRGIFGRLRRQVERALSGERAAPAPWMRQYLRGRPVWQARYPLGAAGDVTLCTFESPVWVEGLDQRWRTYLEPFQLSLATGKIAGGYLFGLAGSLRLMELDRRDPAAYNWLDPTAAEVFATVSAAKVWGIVWAESGAIVPLAIVTPGGKLEPSRLTHLIPGAPTDILLA